MAGLLSLVVREAAPHPSGPVLARHIQAASASSALGNIQRSADWKSIARQRNMAAVMAGLAAGRQ
jgi:hypothetical protein